MYAAKCITTVIHIDLSFWHTYESILAQMPQYLLTTCHSVLIGIYLNHQTLFVLPHSALKIKASDDERFLKGKS